MCVHMCTCTWPCVDVCICTPLKGLRDLLYSFNPILSITLQASPIYFPERKDNSERAVDWPGSHGRLGPSQDEGLLLPSSLPRVSAASSSCPLPPSHLKKRDSRGIGWVITDLREGLSAGCRLPEGVIQPPHWVLGKALQGEVWGREHVSLSCSAIPAPPRAGFGGTV